MDVGRQLQQARRRAGLTQADLARRGGTSQATISAYETGAKLPSLPTLERILAAAGARLAIEPAAAPVTRPKRARHARTAKALVDVLALAEALPTRHDRALRFPRLPAPRERIR